MHKAIAKQLDLDERQTRQLKQELEARSWLYSTSTWKRALAIYGYGMLGWLRIFGPFLFLMIAIPNLIVALR